MSLRFGCRRQEKLQRESKDDKLSLLTAFLAVKCWLFLSSLTRPEPAEPYMASGGNKKSFGCWALQMATNCQLIIHTAIHISKCLVSSDPRSDPNDGFRSSEVGDNSRIGSVVFLPYLQKNAFFIYSFVCS